MAFNDFTSSRSLISPGSTFHCHLAPHISAPVTNALSPVEVRASFSAHSTAQGVHAPESRLSKNPLSETRGTVAIGKMLSVQRDSALSEVVAARWMTARQRTAAVFPPAAPPKRRCGPFAGPHLPRAQVPVTSCLPLWVPEAPRRSSARPGAHAAAQCHRAWHPRWPCGSPARSSRACG